LLIETDVFLLQLNGRHQRNNEIELLYYSASNYVKLKNDYLNQALPFAQMIT